MTNNLLTLDRANALHEALGFLHAQRHHPTVTAAHLNAIDEAHALLPVVNTSSTQLTTSQVDELHTALTTARAQLKQGRMPTGLERAVELAALLVCDLD